MSEMRTLRFYGASDDLFEIEGTVGDEPDEIGSYLHATAVRVVDPSGGGLIVVAAYDHEGWPKGLPACWTIGICPLDEGIPIPPWAMRWSLSERGYSSQLDLDVPAGAVVSRVGTHHD